MPKVRPLIGDPVPAELTGKALKFAQLMSQGRDWERAGEEAGLTVKSARQYRYRYRDVIMAMTAERTFEGTALAVDTLVTLMRNGESENVRLGAARDWLDRFGAPAVRRVVFDVQTASDDALRAYLLEALGSQEAVDALLTVIRPQALVNRQLPALEGEAHTV